MFNFLLHRMSRYQKVVEKTFKIKNYDPFILPILKQDYNGLGLDFPSSRMYYNSPKKVISEKNKFKNYKCYSCNTEFKPVKYNLFKATYDNDTKLSEIEKIIGLDFPNSRFKK